MLCFNAPAPTEIYTYLLHLSLPDALPICGARTTASRPCRACSRAIFLRRQPLGVATHHACLCPGKSCRDVGRPKCRSEEHTSELQSLMRISYAVFCLKKKHIMTAPQANRDEIQLPRHLTLTLTHSP